MTTQTWTSIAKHSVDADFRTIGSELNTALAAVGLVQTADTGQINWTTVTRPGATNTEAGYEIWRFNDTQQGSAPIYFRLGFGTTTNINTFRLTIIVGTGSNGSGTITGALTGTINFTYNNSSAAAGTFASYLCHIDGHLALAWKTGASTANAFLVLSRTCDDTGTPDAHGAFLYYREPTNTAQIRMSCLRFAATAALTVSGVQGYTTFVPGNMSTSVVGSDTQVFQAFGAFPGVRTCLGVCGIISSELTAHTTMSCALIGATAHTYLMMGSQMGDLGGSNLRAAMIYE